MRDAGLTVPEGLVRHLHIPCGPHPENLLDVYYPKETITAHPTIVSIHGGSWLYGSKVLHRLLKKGAESILKIYGTKEQKDLGHVFHQNCRSSLADACNDEQCSFFRAHMQMR